MLFRDGDIKNLVHSQKILACENIVVDDDRVNFKINIYIDV